jgi:protein tyrosine/serine phosphatase
MIKRLSVLLLTISLLIGCSVATQSFDNDNKSHTRTNNREDYSDDRSYANYREVSIGNIRQNWLYRSSSPVNNGLNRSAYVLKLMEQDQIKTIIDLADNDEEIRQFLADPALDLSYYRTIYDSGDIAMVDLGVEYLAYDFDQGMIKALRFMIDHPGPYLIHCNEGKDRTGYLMIIIEALLDASYDQIAEDYMRSYVNYYFLKEDEETYKNIEEKRFKPLIYAIGKLESDSDLSSIDLKQLSIDYLIRNGFSQKEIDQLIEALVSD